MSSMRIRKEFAAAFVFLLVAAAFAGLNNKESKLNPGNYTNVVPHGDKGLHFVTFFSLTCAFYWIFETSRRRAVNLTAICITVLGSVGSEILQGALPNGREFDYLDIVANVAGSGAALALCAWYHRRMLERKRASKRYSALTGDEEAAVDGERDIELGSNIGAQQSGVTDTRHDTNIDEELDNWDENEADDWDEDETGGKGDAQPASTASAAPADVVGKGKRDD